jgi:Cu2+-exporting ATPase
MAFGKKETITLTVTGMTCGRCVAHVTKALEGVPGVSRARVTLPASAEITTKPGTDHGALLAAVAEAGYEAAQS